MKSFFSPLYASAFNFEAFRFFNNFPLVPIKSLFCLMPPLHCNKLCSATNYVKTIARFKEFLMPRPVCSRQRNELSRNRRLFLITRLKRASNCPAKDPKPTNPNSASPSVEGKNKQLGSPAKNRAIFKRNSLKKTTKHSSPSSTCANLRNYDHLDSQIKNKSLWRRLSGCKVFSCLSAPVTQARVFLECALGEMNTFWYLLCKQTQKTEHTTLSQQINNKEHKREPKITFCLVLFLGISNLFENRC